MARSHRRHSTILNNLAFYPINSFLENICEQGIQIGTQLTRKLTASHVSNILPDGTVFDSLKMEHA